MYKASEKDISATVNDFVRFCNFIDQNNPVLTKKKGVLGKKDLFELNSLLAHKKEVVAPNFQQEAYPVIDLLFNLALAGKLYQRIADHKGNVHLIHTVRKDEFDSLNIFEKYAFLFETFWTRYDFGEIANSYIFSRNPIDRVVETIAFSKPGEELRRGAFSGYEMDDPIFSSYSVIIQYLDYFGLCTYIPVVENGKKLTKYDDRIEAVIPTEFGVNVCKILAEYDILNWNIPWLKKNGLYEKNISDNSHFGVDLFSQLMNVRGRAKASRSRKRKHKRESVPFYKLLEPVFPEGVLNKTVTAEIHKDVEGNYVFKVSLGRGVWRKIKISSRHTLEDLHDAIQMAFDFDNDHLYSFFMDGKKYSDNAYHAPLLDEGPYVNQVRIGELDLYEGQHFLYFFDYGDSWEFDVQLLQINRDEPLLKKPEVIEEKGKAPRQYGYYYDDDDEDDDWGE
jgi:hypothetical protein